jgi:hypothetical protein
MTFITSTSASSALTSIPQYNSDPASPSTENVWVRKTGGTTTVTGTPLGLLLALTHSITTTGGTPMGLLLSITKDTSPTYELRYRTLEGTTKGVSIT